MRHGHSSLGVFRDQKGRAIQKIETAPQGRARSDHFSESIRSALAAEKLFRKRASPRSNFYALGVASDRDSVSPHRGGEARKRHYVRHAASVKGPHLLKFPRVWSWSASTFAGISDGRVLLRDIVTRPECRWNFNALATVPLHRLIGGRKVVHNQEGD